MGVFGTAGEKMGRGDVARNLIIIALLAALAFSWVWMLARRLGPERLVNRTEMFRGYGAFVDPAINFTIAGDWGMGHTIKENDVVMWVKVDPSRLQVGDIILYRDPSKPGNPLVAHRISEIIYGSFSTKGDGLPADDPYLIKEELEGIVIGVIYHRAP